MSIQTRFRNAPAMADTPAQKCIRLGASVTLAYWRKAGRKSGKSLGIEVVDNNYSWSAAYELVRNPTDVYKPVSPLTKDHLAAWLGQADYLASFE